MPAGRLAEGYGSGDFKGYVAVAAYYVDLPGRPDDGPALRANVLDAAILGGRASALDGRGGFLAVLVLAVALGLDLEGRAAAGSNIVHAGLLGQPFGGIFGEGCYRPAVGLMMLDVQAVGLGGVLEFLVVIIAVVAYVLDLMGQVVEVRHFVEHGRRDLRDWAVDVLGADVDFAVGLLVGLPDFVYAAPAIRAAPAVGRYRQSMAKVPFIQTPTYEDYVATDAEARRIAESLI